MQQNNVLDTSPVINEYGVFWSRVFGQTAVNSNWCITKYYDVNDPYTDSQRNTKINGYVGADTSYITFQFYKTNGSTTSTDYWYFAGTNPRQVITNTKSRVVSISFSIQTSEIDNSYAYIEETGQILFAGKNTPYYGHRNISELN